MAAEELHDACEVVITQIQDLAIGHDDFAAYVPHLRARGRWMARRVRSLRAVPHRSE